MASGDSSSSDEDVAADLGGTSSPEEGEELPIAKIIAHRDTKGQPDDPNLAYYTVRFAGLDDLGEEGEDELPEEPTVEGPQPNPNE